jgi:hypothetical protein
MEELPTAKLSRDAYENPLAEGDTSFSRDRLKGGRIL